MPPLSAGVSGTGSGMLTDEEIRRLIALKSEGPNLDYKAGFAWMKDSRDKKYELIRDLMAFSNTERDKGVRNLFPSTPGQPVTAKRRLWYRSLSPSFGVSFSLPRPH